MRSTTKILALVCSVAAANLAHAAELKFGLAVTLTGPVAQYGVAVRNGFQLAAEEINAKGGIRGDKIRLIIEDEQSNKDEAVEVVTRMVNQDKVLMVFGPTLSNSMFAAAPVANAANTVIFGTSVTASGITDIGPYVFRNSLMEANVLPVTVASAQKYYKLKKVAVIYGTDDAFTKSGYDVFKMVLAEQGLAITATETYLKGDGDFKAQLARIKASEPNAVVCSCLADEASNILLQARSLGIKVPFIGGNGFSSPRLFEVSRLAGEGTFVGSPWANTSPAPVNKTFVAAYAKKFSVEATQHAAQAYDAMYIVASALKDVNLSGDLSKDREALKNALPRVSITGATGPFKFRAAKPKDGKAGGWDAEQTPFIYVVRGGRFVLFDGK